MPTYVMLGSYTDQGIRNIRQTAQRWDANRRQIEAAGGTIQRFITMGQYDFVNIVEMPSDEAYASLTMATGSQGNVRLTSMRAFTEEEARRIIQGLPSA